MAKLITSIPAKELISEQSREGVINRVRAWKSIGISTISINGESELNLINNFNCSGNIEFIAAECTYEKLYNRPLVPIFDVIRNIYQYIDSGEVCGIVNSDIEPNELMPWSDLINNIQQNELHIFKRLDYGNNFNYNDINPFCTYRYGYDLFLFGGSSAPFNEFIEADLKFCFGVPWWDYWFPLLAYKNGFKVIVHEHPWIFHKTHKEKFDQSIWQAQKEWFLSFINKYFPEFCFINNHLSDEEICEKSIRAIDSLQYTKESVPPKLSGISICTASMNREQNLLIALKTWLRFDQVKEIIITDWSSEVSVTEFLSKSNISDSRIRVIRVENKPIWHLSKAFNISLKASNYANILKLDADIILEQDFFDKNILKPDCFIAGNWRTANTDDEKRCNGSFYASFNALYQVGFYNEYIETYGWDDSELYQRLEKICTRTDFAHNTVKHLKQLSITRTQYQKGKLAINPLLISSEVETELEIRVNQIYSWLMPEWGSGKPLAMEPNSKLLIRQIAYKCALIRFLAADYLNFGSELSVESLAKLPSTLLAKLFAARHQKNFWGNCNNAIDFLRMFLHHPLTPEEAYCLENSHDPYIQEALMRSDALLGSYKSNFFDPFHNQGILKKSHILEANDISVANPLTDFLKINIRDKNDIYFQNPVALKSYNKKIVVPIVVFNSEDFIFHLIANIKELESLNDVLFVFIVPGSDSNDVGYLLKHLTENINYCVILLTWDPGLYNCWNGIIDSSLAPYVSNWNCDDRKSPDHLTHLINILDRHSNYLAASTALFVSYVKNQPFSECKKESLPIWFNEGDLVFDHTDMFQYAWWESEPDRRSKVCSNNYLHCMPVWRKSIHDACGFFDEEEYGPSADWEFWMRASLITKQKYFLSHYPRGVYFFNPKSYGRRPEAEEKEEKIFFQYKKYWKKNFE